MENVDPAEKKASGTRRRRQGVRCSRCAVRGPDAHRRALVSKAGGHQRAHPSGGRGGPISGWARGRGVIQEGDGALFSLPKGHVEPGETLEHAAAREVREEAGIAGAAPVAILGVRERLNFARTWWNKTHYFLFIVESAAEHRESRRRMDWFPIDALPAMFWPEQRELVESSREEIVRRVEAQAAAGTKSSVQR